MTAQLDQYDFWRRRLAGENLPIHDGEVQAGFYRMKRREGGFDPVAYWWKDGELRCRIGGRDVNEQIARERWMWASKDPISHELYTAVVGGAPWPDEHAAVSGHNKGPQDDSFDGLKQSIEDFAEAANNLIKAGGAKTQAEADQASHLANKLAELQATAEDQRKAEKKPHDDAARAVQQKWMPVIDTADVYRRIKAVVITPFLRKLDDERIAAEAEARKAAELAVKAGEPIPEPVHETRAPVKAGTGGRRSVALRTVTRVAITDRAAVLEYFKDRPEITDVLQAMAEKAVKAGVVIPGIQVTKDKEAA